MHRNAGWLLAAVALCSLVVPWTVARAQVEANLGAYTGANAEGYLKPLQDAVSVTLNDAWFRNARIAPTGLSVNVEIKTMVFKFKDDDRVFQASTEPGFYPARNDVEAPTIVGDTLAVVIPGDNGTSAVLPGGLDVNSFGFAVPQLTIGSVMGTQAIFRYMAYDQGDIDLGDISFLGIGLRHNLSQYFNALPVDLAVGGMYQSLDVGEDDLVDATTWTFGIQGSKQLGALEPYAGLGYDMCSMKVTYDESANTENKLGVDFDDESTIHGMVGLGLNLAVFHLSGEVNISSHTSYGLGLSVGN